MALINKKIFKFKAQSLSRYFKEFEYKCRDGSIYLNVNYEFNVIDTLIDTEEITEIIETFPTYLEFFRPPSGLGQFTLSSNEIESIRTKIFLILKSLFHFKLISFLNKTLALIKQSDWNKLGWIYPYNFIVLSTWRRSN